MTTFNIIVNNAPAVTDYTDSIIAVGGTISILTPFTDVDLDTLTYTGELEDGSATITPFALDSVSGTVTGQFDNTGYYLLKVTATDPSGASVSSWVRVTANDAPVVNTLLVSDQ